MDANISFQREPGSNGNTEVLYTTQISRIETPSFFQVNPTPQEGIQSTYFKHCQLGIWSQNFPDNLHNNYFLLFFCLFFPFYIFFLWEISMYLQPT